VRDLNGFFDGFPFGIFRCDAEGCATYANPAFGEISETDAGQLLGAGWLRAVHPADRDRVLQEWRAACAADRSLDTTFWLQRADGAHRFLRLRSRPVAEDGAARDYVAVLVDHTEQRLAERRLRRNNELLSAVLENIPCGIAVYDADASLILDNQQTEFALDFPADRHDEALIPFATMAPERRPGRVAPADAERTWPDAGDTLAPRVREEVQPDGRVFAVRDAPMPAGGLVTTYTDITEQRHHSDTLQRAQAAAEQALNAKAAFLATMSHEIRTPMNGVIGLTNILLETRLTPDQRELVEVIRQSGESLLVVVNDILDYSKIESGQMELEWLPLRLQAVMDNCLHLLGPQAQKKGVRLVVEVDPRIPALILGDRTRLQQVLVNLISNAVKFTDDGQVCVRLADASVGQADGPQSTGDLCEVEVRIEDTGIGIPPDKLETIFEPFVQADSSTARRFGGTGLGLAIAKRLVHAMGGSISLTSEVGRGTEVRFTFMAEAAVPRCRATARHQLPLWRKRVLLLTGTRADVGVLRTQLARWGMEVEPCTRAAEARARLVKSDSFDLVLAAAHISDARWFEFVRGLRAQGVGVPAVLLSRGGSAALHDEALDARIVAQSSSEAVLYDGLAAALQGRGDPGCGDTRSQPQFDDTLGQTAPLRILVAEDNEINRKLVLRTLAAFGYEADVAQNGAQAIAAVRRRAYDLVLMDIRMPEVDGIEATKFIVGNFPAGRRPRIIAMSASVMREDVDAALAAGADHYVAKPFSPAELRAALEGAAHRGPAQQPTEPEEATQLLAPDRLRCHLETDPGGEFLEELCRDFIRTTGELEGLLCSKVRAQEVEQLREVVHEYAGVCAAVGAPRLMHLLGRLQKIARAGSVTGAALLVRQCVQVREQTVAALESAVRERQAAAGAAVQA
jgi:PAS domain S-box-containing protein